MLVVDANTVFGGYPKRSVDTALERLLAVLRRHAVDRAVTCSTTGMLYDAAAGNDETLAVCAEHRELVPAATVNPTRYYGHAGIGHMVERGFRLLRLFNGEQGWPVQSYAPFEAVCAEADEAGLPILLDVKGQGQVTAVGEVARRLSVPVIVAGCNYHALAEVVAVGRRTPNLCVELHQLVVPDGIEILCRHLGSERLVYGSQAPLNYLGHTLTILKGAAVAEADRAAIAGGNMARILGLDLPAEEPGP